MRQVLLSAIYLLFAQFALSQTSISGTVTDADTGKPVYGVNVFIENSTVGTVSDPGGKYTIENIRGDYPKVVFSHIGYYSSSQPVNGRKQVNVELKPKIEQLTTVEIERDKDRKWKRYYEQFEEAFIGKTENAGEVTITNPWAMELSKTDQNELSGFSVDLLEIENRALGYKIKFLVENFILSSEQTVYQGKPLFEPMIAADKNEADKWEAARKKTYLGSKQHFLYALAQGTVEQEGFELHNAEFDQKYGQFRTLEKIKSEEIFEEGKLKLAGFLKVVYTQEKPEKAFVKEFSSATKISYSGRNRNLGSGEMVINEHASKGGQISYLYSRTRGLAINEKGLPKNPEYLLEYGYWAWERVAELLPHEYHLDYIAPEEPVIDIAFEEPETSQQEQPEPDSPDGPRKNGFDLSGAILPVDEIVLGGPPKDGIRSITNPKLETPTAAGWLNDEDVVLGVVFNGEARAYPVRMLNMHEAVNDQIGGLSFVVSYCPLCGSGVVFNSKVDGNILDFGISGLLYNSGVLLYDRKTESLWSQLEMKAITGRYAETPLEILPSYQLSWADWKKRYPDTKVMSRDVPFRKNYDDEPYKDYRSDNRLYFAVNKTSNRMANKDEVIGVSLNGEHKAYLVRRLMRQKNNPIEDKLGGETIYIEYLPDSEGAIVTNSKKEVIASIKLFWFAWYAFHPDTKIY